MLPLSCFTQQEHCQHSWASCIGQVGTHGSCRHPSITFVTTNALPWQVLSGDIHCSSAGVERWVCVSIRTWVPAEMKADRSTDAPWPSKVRKQLPSANAQRRMVASPLPVSTHWSTGENCALHTPRRCPFSVSVCTRSGSRHTCTTPASCKSGYGEETHFFHIRRESGTCNETGIVRRSCLGSAVL